MIFSGIFGQQPANLSGDKDDTGFTFALHHRLPLGQCLHGDILQFADADTRSTDSLDNITDSGVF